MRAREASPVAVREYTPQIERSIEDLATQASAILGTGIIRPLYSESGRHAQPIADAHRLIGSLAEVKNPDWLLMDRRLTRRRESPLR